LNQGHRLLVDESGQIPDAMQVVFISVDPDRDSSEKLAEYVNYFDKDFIGTTADKINNRSSSATIWLPVISLLQKHLQVYTTSLPPALFFLSTLTVVWWLLFHSLTRRRPSPHNTKKYGSIFPGTSI